MPRAWTPEEEARHRAALMDVARERFAAAGLKGVSVSALTRAAGIGKGSFYLLFSSKEALFFAVHEAVGEEIEAELVAALEGLTGAALLERYFGFQLERLQTHPFLRQLTAPGTLETLRAKLPPALIADHEARDRAFYTGLVRAWIERGALPPTLDPELVFELSAAAFALSLHRDIVGHGFPRVASTLARALARELA